MKIALFPSRRKYDIPVLTLAKGVFKALDGTVLIFNFIVDSVLKSAWIQSKHEFLRYATFIKK